VTIPTVTKVTNLMPVLVVNTSLGETSELMITARVHRGCDDRRTGADRRAGRQRGKDDRDIEEVAQPEPRLLVDGERAKDREAAHGSRDQKGMAKPIPHCPT